MSATEAQVENAEQNQSSDGIEADGDANVVEVVPGFANFDDYVKTAFGAMRAGIKAANSLPCGENFNYYACFPKFNEVRSKEAAKILNILQNVIELAGTAGNVRRRDIEEKFELLVESNDIFLDRAGICMDEEAGIPKKPNVALIVSQTNRKNVYGSWNATTSTQIAANAEPATSASSIRLLAAKNVQRPQLTFKDKIDNSAKPWQPRIKEKPNSIKPLAIYMENGESGEFFNHPYECELEKFEPPEKQLKRIDPILYKNLNDTPLIVIEKCQDIKILLKDLSQYDEIAVDLEHHSYRTFQGITCLMQISTRDTDYLIDTLSLRSDLHVLNEIFTNPKILKVFHGADSDVLWLQRDLSIYVVNMFDTHQAAKQLDFTYLSLAFLMKKYCNLDPNKHFQLADWRIRPLPEELMKYAREDTHYLLYIKDILRNELIDAANGQSNVLKVVYDRSTEVCKRSYAKPVWTDESYLNMYRKSQKMFNNRQLYALREIHRWRDATAREEDDSCGYVLPNHMLLNIAETLPREMQGILACCNPIPPLVRQNLLRLHKIILKARDQPLIKPILEQDMRQRLTQRSHAVDSGVWICTPHDNPSGMEVGANLPCLLDAATTPTRMPDTPKIDHSVTVFDSPPVSDDDEASERQRILRRKRTLFVSPFERYKRVMPMVAAQEEEERKKFENEEAERCRLAELEQKRTTESKERVHEHFKRVARGDGDVDSSPKPKKFKPQQVPLSQMHGRKRKRESNVGESSNGSEKFEYDASTPKPSTDVTVCNSYAKKRKNEDSELSGNRKQEKHDASMGNGPERKTPNRNIGKKNKKNNSAIVLSTNEGRKRDELTPVKRFDVFSSSQQKRKDQKIANLNELQQKGMLPQTNFDYKSVDFSSFQGGSKSGDLTKSTQFQQQKQKDKIKKGKKRKKQKINGI